MKGKVNCTCGWSWNKSDSSKKDMYICHECGRDNSNNMKNGGWLDNYNDSQASAPEGMVGDGFSNVGRNYSPAWGGQFQEGGEIPMAQDGKATRADSLDVYNRALKIDAYYDNLKKKGWYGKKDVFPTTGLTSKKLEKEMKKVDKESRATYKDQARYEKGVGYLNNAYPNADPKKVNQKALAEHIALTKGTKYATKDNYPSIIDPMAPTTVIDTRIIPKENVTYYDRRSAAEDKFFRANPNVSDKDYHKYSVANDKKFKNTTPPGGSITNLYRYDPLSVKPWDMLTDAEKKLRVEKYGTDGVPKSYIDKNKPQDKPDKKDKTDKQRPKLEAIVNNLQPQVVNSDFDVTAQLPIIRKPVVNPKSYDVNSQRQTMSGPSDYYDYNDEEVDLTAAIKSKKAADAYNKYAQEKYKEAAKTNPKAQERLDTLKQNVEIVPNYQTGGSLPGATGNMYARVGAPSNGPYAKKTMPSAQVGKKIKIKDERGQMMKPSESTAVKRKDFNIEQSKENKTYINAVAAQKKEAARRAKLTKDQREREDYNAYNQEHGNISKYTPESTWQRTKAIVSNPMTAAGYVARGENLPGNFQAGPRNAHDYAVDWINPLQGAAALSEIPGELGRGEFLEAGLSGLDALDLGPYARGAMKVAKPLMKPIKKTLAKGALKTFEKARDLEKFGKGKVEDLKMLANDAARSVDDNFIYPIKYRKQIADVKKLHNNLSTELGSDEAAKRLSGVLGIDTSNLNYPSLTTRPRMGSHYNSQSNNINMDFRQLNEFKNSDDYMLSPNTVYDHEVGHWMQTEAYKNSPDYARELDNHKQELADYEKQLSLYNSPGNKALENTNHDNATQEELRHWFLNYIPKPYKPRAPFPTAAPTKIDRFAQQLYGYDKGTNMINIDKVSNPIDTNMLESNARYFTKRGVEPLAHLREMRQNMLTKDYIKDKYGPISEETINKFVSENPSDRVSSFTIPGSNQIKGLADIFRNLPSVVGPSAIGAGAVGTAAYQMQDEEPLPGMRGGGVIRDDRGQWDHPGEITEIGSNQITMQGVPYPVLGISDTGDTKMMQPGEDYKFKGKKVTEYPMAQDGKKFDFSNGPAGNMKQSLITAVNKDKKQTPDIKERKTTAVDKTSVKQQNKKIEKEPTSKERLKSSINNQARFIKDWMDSPMYDEMVDNSTTGYFDEQYLNSGRDFNFDNVKVVTKPQPKDSPRVGADSNNETGLIRLFPLGAESDALDGMLAHEISHSSDKPTDWDANWFEQHGLRPVNKYNNKYTKKEVRLIPEKDINLMKSFYSDNKTYKKLFNKSALKNKDLNEDREWFNYVSEPTETRARLNDIRYNAKKYGVYDPFTQKVTPKILNEIKELTKKAGGFDPFNQLQGVYSDEEILKLLNTVSQNEQPDENPNVATAKNGIRQEQKGLVNLDQLTNFTNYNKPQPGGWLNKYN